MEDRSDKNSKRALDDSVGTEPESSEFKRTRLESGSTLDGYVSESGTLRVHSDEDSAPSESVLTRADSFESSDNSNFSEQLPAESVSSPLDSSEAKRMQYDLLNFLEETDSVLDRDLDSVMKILENELLVPVPDTDPEPHEHEIRCELQPDLGYLLDASDDELGLPPTWISSEERSVEEGIDSETVIPEARVFHGFEGFEDDIPSYDSFDFRFDDPGSNPCNPNESVSWVGLLDFSELGDSLWRSESLHAT